MVCVQELEEQGRMLGGALTALAAREEALRTARTLDDDLGRLRARAESMQASGHPKAVRMLCCCCCCCCRNQLQFLLRSVVVLPETFRPGECISNTASVWISVL
jgi:hypothetical protein